jgi:hypothetical protein
MLSTVELFTVRTEVSTCLCEGPTLDTPLLVLRATEIPTTASGGRRVRQTSCLHRAANRRDHSCMGRQSLNQPNARRVVPEGARLDPTMGRAALRTALGSGAADVERSRRDDSLMHLPPMIGSVEARTPGTPANAMCRR